MSWINILIIYSQYNNQTQDTCGLEVQRLNRKRRTAAEIRGSDPFEDGLPAVLFSHMKFLNQIEAGEDVRDIIQASYLS